MVLASKKLVSNTPWAENARRIVSIIGILQMRTPQVENSTHALLWLWHLQTFVVREGQEAEIGARSWHDITCGHLMASSREKQSTLEIGTLLYPT